MPTLEHKNPFTGETSQSYEIENFDLLEDKVNRLHQAQKRWALESLDKRVELVSGALKYFRDNSETIAKDITAQMGRPLKKARGEINGLLERAEFMCECASSSLATESIVDTNQHYKAIEHRPLGLVFVLSAWNYPLLISINSIVPALLAGNTVLLKHSSLTPEIGRHFEKAFSTLGGHKDLLLSVVLDHATCGEAIEKLPVDQVVFTGSVEGGRQILKHCSQKFLQPQLELGGKDAAVVCADCDLDQAAESVADGAFFNAGQSCCGIERVYVESGVHDLFVEKCRSLAMQFKLGDPMEESTTMGPLANPRSADLMLGQIDDALKDGAKLVCGGKDQKISAGRFMEATILIDVNQKAKLVQEENFGPLLAVLKFESIEEAINLVNDSRYGLSSAIFTKDFSKAKNFSDRVDCGTVFLNSCDYLDPKLPWTGVKNSGCGSALSKYGFSGVTRKMSINFKKE